MAASINMNETGIKIDDSVCWICGRPFSTVKSYQKTIHHTLPRHMTPTKNVQVPLHRGCHDRLTTEDKAATIKFIFKLIAQTRTLSINIRNLNKIMEEKDDEMQNL